MDIRTQEPSSPRTNRDTSSFRPDLSTVEQTRGRHSGDRYIHIVRHAPDEFSYIGENLLLARLENGEDRSLAGRIFVHIKRALIGAPLSTAAAAHERLSNRKALAVLSSDALSSVAYASEEILRVLLIAGLGALSLSLPIGAGIVLLLLIVGASYRQTIKAYPHGGGSYIVAKDNLGETPALIAGGALLADYVLTVAVSVSSAVAAIVSAFPAQHDHLISWGVFFIALITLLNLRGIRESGTIFAVPTYLFLLAIGTMIVVGIARNASEGFAVHEAPAHAMACNAGITVFLVLRAL